MILVVTGESAAARRVLAAALPDAEVVADGEGDLRLDLATGRVHLPGQVVAVVLGTPAAGEVGVVEDLLVDRAFPDVPEEATVLAELGDLALDTVEELHAALAAAALARAAGVGADAVRRALSQA